MAFSTQDNDVHQGTTYELRFNPDTGIMEPYLGVQTVVLSGTNAATTSLDACVEAAGQMATSSDLGYTAPAWDSGTAYVVNDVVSSGGSYYKCTAGHTNQVPPDTSYWKEVYLEGSPDGRLQLTGIKARMSRGVVVSQAVWSRDDTVRDFRKTPPQTAWGDASTIMVKRYLKVTSTSGTPAVPTAWDIASNGDSVAIGRNGQPMTIMIPMPRVMLYYRTVTEDITNFGLLAEDKGRFNSESWQNFPANTVQFIDSTPRAYYIGSNREYEIIYKYEQRPAAAWKVHSISSNGKVVEVNIGTSADDAGLPAAEANSASGPFFTTV